MSTLNPVQIRGNYSSYFSEQAHHRHLFFWELSWFHFLKSTRSSQNLPKYVNTKFYNLGLNWKVVGALFKIIGPKVLVII